MAQTKYWLHLQGLQFLKALCFVVNPQTQCCCQVLPSRAGTIPVPISLESDLTEEQKKASRVCGLRTLCMEGPCGVGTESLQSMQTKHNAQQIEPKDATGTYWSYVLDTIKK